MAIRLGFQITGLAAARRLFQNLKNPKFTIEPRSLRRFNSAIDSKFRSLEQSILGSMRSKAPVKTGFLRSRISNRGGRRRVAISSDARYAVYVQSWQSVLRAEANSYLRRARAQSIRQRVTIIVTFPGTNVRLTFKPMVRARLGEFIRRASLQDGVFKVTFIRFPQYNRSPPRSV